MGEKVDVKLKNGTILEFPDDAPLDSITRFIDEKYPEEFSDTMPQLGTIDIVQFRKKYPQYNDLSDYELVSALQKKFYPSLGKYEIAEKLSISGVKMTFEQGINFVNYNPSVIVIVFAIAIIFFLRKKIAYVFHESFRLIKSIPPKYVIFFALLFSLFAYFHEWTYEDCILKNMAGANNPYAVQAIKDACRAKRR